MSDNYLLNMYEKALKLPAGRKLFSMVFSRKAPYFATITPVITELRPNFCEVKFKKRKGVENHIQTVHVIAICNALECAMGAMAESSIPKHLRWIPKGMDVRYTAKATSDITCVAETDPEQWTADLGAGYDLAVRVKGVRDDGTTVIDGSINLWISPKK